MQIDAANVLEYRNKSFEELQDFLSAARKSILEKKGRLSNIETYGKPDGGPYKALKLEIQRLELRIAGIKRNIRDLLPQEVIDNAVDFHITKSQQLLSEIKIFAASRMESYYADVPIEKLHEQFVRHNKVLVANYQFSRRRLMTERFSYDVTDFELIDELDKTIKNSTSMLYPPSEFEQFVAVLALRITTNAPYNINNAGTRALQES